MKTRTGLLPVLYAALALAAQADDGELIARRISGPLPLDPDAAAWQKTTARTVPVYPQNTLRLADTPADKAGVAVQALYSKDEIALRLEWDDPAAQTSRGIGRFADAAAVQWPVQYGPGVRLPYVGMGDPEQPVALWFWQGDGATETLAAAGFGTLTAQAADGVQAQGAWKDGRWRVVFKRPLAGAGEHRLNLDPARQGLAPVAFALWDGAAAQRDGVKRLSGWLALRFDQGAADRPYARQLQASVSGDPAAGKRLMTEKGCAACHAYPGNPAQPVVGPDLSHAGGIHHAAYLLESIAEPSRVIVPGKGYSMAQDGKKISLMPPFQGTEQERHDIAVFLQTLR